MNKQYRALIYWKQWELFCVRQPRKDAFWKCQGTAQVIGYFAALKNLYETELSRVTSGRAKKLQ